MHPFLKNYKKTHEVKEKRKINKNHTFLSPTINSLHKPRSGAGTIASFLCSNVLCNDSQAYFVFSLINRQTPNFKATKNIYILRKQSL